MQNLHLRQVGMPDRTTVFLQYTLAVLVCFPVLWVASWFKGQTSAGYFILALGAGMLSTWAGGLGPGMTTTLLYGLLANFYLIEPLHAVTAKTLPEVLQLLVYIVLGSIMNWFVGRLKSTQLRLHETTRFLNTVLNSVTDGISVQRHDGTVIFLNEAGGNLTGLPNLAVAVKSPAANQRRRYALTRMDNSPLAGHDLPDRQVFITQKPAELTYFVHDLATNTERWINHKSAPVVDETGVVHYAVNVFRDVTDSQAREAELTRLNNQIAAYNHRFRAILNNVPGMVWEAKGRPGEEQRVTYLNPHVEKMLGYTLEEWQAQPELWLNTIHPEDRDEALAKAQQAYNEQTDTYLSYRMVTKDERTIHVETYMTIAQDSAGAAEATYGLTIDVTSRKQAEEQLAQTTAELQRSNEELQQFAYIASHDLQEPLRMVSSYLQLLDQRYRPQLDEEAREFIYYAVDGAARMKQLITDLLTYSRVERGKREFGTFSLQQALEQAMANLEMRIAENEATITAGELPEIRGDAHQFVLLFQNLITNAIKFRREPAPAIHIGAVRKRKEWIISIHDNGIGIESGYMDRIFVIFQRLHSRDQYEGTGIGLAICKKIVERHGGKIWVESMPGQGSTFLFTIPQKNSRSPL